MADISNNIHKESRNPGLLVILLSLLVLVADQTMKIWIKTHFYLGEDYPITSWWQLKFIENNGMAFGMELPSKIILTLGRIIVVIAIIWFLKKIINNTSLRSGFFAAMALIMAGAAGNIFDCVFYGIIFNNPYPPQVAEIFPPDGGYAPIFMGRVVDMLFFPLFSFTWPEWVPGIGGTEYLFFQYIFNIADASICIGVFLLIFFYFKDVSEAANYVGNLLKARRNDSRTK
ncbi:MAG: lipoprotein signal peptidase [Muribaculaceae bacterium]|nr:lipoprotein signal peptidase [Muribaculaceae bacterium]